VDIDPKDTSLKAALERFLVSIEAEDGYTSSEFEDSFSALVTDAIKNEPFLLPMVVERVESVWLHLEKTGGDDNVAGYWSGWLNLLEALIEQLNPSQNAPLRESFPYERELLRYLSVKGEAGEDAEAIAMSRHRRETQFQTSLEGLHVWGWVEKMLGTGDKPKWRICAKGRERLRTLEGNNDQPNEG
jgi:hypothetical protein